MSEEESKATLAPAAEGARHTRQKEGEPVSKFAEYFNNSRARI